MSPERFSNKQHLQDQNNNAYYPTLPPKRSPYENKKAPLMSGAQQEDPMRSGCNEEPIGSID